MCRVDEMNAADRRDAVAAVAIRIRNYIRSCGIP
jgi:hypothetical protein